MTCLAARSLERLLTPLRLHHQGGKFWNTYNEYLPLDTLALCGALAEWGHAVEAQAYLGLFLETRVCSQEVCHTISGKGGQGHKDVSKGQIIYSVFGCDSDADYGRIIALFAQLVRTSGNTTWATSMLPTVQVRRSMLCLASRLS